MARGIWNWNDPILTTDADDYEAAFGRDTLSGGRRPCLPLVACAAGIAVITILTIRDNGAGGIGTVVGTIALLSIVWVVWVFVFNVVLATMRGSWGRHPIACVVAAGVFLGLAGWPLVRGLLALLAHGDVGALVSAVFSAEFVLAPLATEVVLRGLTLAGEVLGRLMKR
ncbi:MAG: hypothetical protein ACI38Z_02815 [Parafannyhessea sp.]|uniref:hypothetical protein n=1 Tax=Parafannyhessea sp. TaxID=2847324 RepID=UPI003F0CB155